MTQFYNLTRQRYIILYVITLVLMISSCEQKPSTELSIAYLADIESWKQKRDINLRSTSGFINLAGLFWFETEKASVGSATSNTLQFPDDTPPVLGKFIIENNIVTFKSAEGINVLIDSIPKEESIVYDAEQKVSKVMSWNSYKWFIIERSGNLGIRLRNLDHPLTKETVHIDYYPVNNKWNVEATYIQFDKPKSLMINNIVGFSFKEEYKGKLEFKVNGKSYSLLPSLGDESMFIMFSDETSGEETYGGGRYMSAGLPVENKVILDFNKAYNPPCAFTDYATCPLPPKENMLPFKLEAGEKVYH